MRAFIVSLCTAVAMMLVGGLTTGRAIADPATGSISGTVTAALGAAELSGVEVDAYVASEAPGAPTVEAGRAATSAQGTYTITGLPTGAYVIEFEPTTGDYLTQFDDDTVDESDATPVMVDAGSTTAGVDDALAGGGQISGTVSAQAGGAALGGVAVTATERDDGQTYPAVSTGMDGSYTIAGLKTGSYTLHFQPGASSGYVPEYSGDTADAASAAVVSVSEGTTTAGVDTALAADGEISGTVTADSGGAALGGVTVEAESTDPPGGSVDVSATTTTDGTYTIPGLRPGSYTVEFEPAAGNYLPHYFDDVSDDDNGDGPVTVTPGSVTSGVDAALRTGGVLSGMVTAADSAAGLAGVTVTAYYEGDGESTTTATTTSDGHYTLEGLVTGTYQVEFAAPAASDYVTQWYEGGEDGYHAEFLPVQAGSDRMGVDATLSVGGEITGTVTDPGAAPPSGDVEVIATRSDGYHQYQATVGSDGTYTLEGMASGSYTVEFAPQHSTTYIDGWYDGAADAYDARSVTVSEGSVASGIDDVLVRGGGISGTVTAASGGATLSGVTVYASGTGANSTEVSTTTGPDGTYSFENLEPGAYYVGFQPPAGDYVYASYRDGTAGSSATPVAVSSGATTPGIDGALATGGVITGTVVAAGSLTPLGDVLVVAETAQGDSWQSVTTSGGSYSIAGLAPGSYTVLFYPQVGNYLTGSYDDAIPSSGQNDPITVGDGTTTSGIDGALASGAEITGTVTAAVGGAALDHVTVEAFGVDEGSAEAQTDSQGRYTITGLATGSYTVSFTPGDSADYLTQYDDDALSESDATSVSVTAGVASTEVDDVLAGTSRVTGTVTAAAGGSGLGGITVTLAGTNDAGRSIPATTATTRSDGSYVVPGLVPGSYTVQFSSPSQTYASQYYDASDADGATTLTVGTATTTSGIDAAMVGAGEITGTVGGAVVPEGDLQNVVVDASTPNPITGPFISLEASLRSDDTYDIRGLPPGRYDVLFSTEGGAWAEQFYENALTSEEATPVTVTPGSRASGIDAGLVGVGSISGTVTTADGGDGMGEVGVAVLDAAGDVVGSTETGEDGSYVVPGLAVGTPFTVRFVPGDGSGYGSQYYDGVSDAADATEVSVTVDGTTTGIDASLTPQVDTGTTTTGTTTTGSTTDMTDTSTGVTTPGSPPPPVSTTTQTTTAPPARVTAGTITSPSITSTRGTGAVTTSSGATTTTAVGPGVTRPAVAERESGAMATEVIVLPGRGVRTVELATGTPGVTFASARAVAKHLTVYSATGKLACRLTLAAHGRLKITWATAENRLALTLTGAALHVTAAEHRYLTRHHVSQLRMSLTLASGGKSFTYQLKVKL